MHGIKALPSAALVAALLTTPAAAASFVYVSAAGDGVINSYALDETTGALTPLAAFDAGKTVMPMAVSPDKKHLYAVIRTQPYRVLTLGIDQGNGALKPEAVAALPDSMPYVATEPSGRLLFTASYGGNKIAVLPVNKDGLVVDGVRQMIPTGLNAHAIVADKTGRYVFATNLGSDAVLQFVLNGDTGLLEPNNPAKLATKPGQGPRHIAVAPDNSAVYVLTELTGDVIHYTLDAATGRLTEVASTPTVPAEAGLAPGIAPPPPAFNATAPVAAPANDGKPKVWAADLGLTPNGRFLYTTERTTSTITAFAVAPGSGALSLIGRYPTETQPRGIRVDPKGRFLIAAGEKSDRLAVYAIDPGTGALSAVGRYPVGAGANWIEIVALP